jgi:glyoxylase-like metal-dependent hydrolase (beta-lactamase superfamily II)
MLRQVADGVLIHTSEFMKSNAIVVQGDSGVLLVDAGVTESEIACLANDIDGLAQPVVAAFSTHPHWDHLLWDASFGSPPRYGTTPCATAARNFLSIPDWKSRLVGLIPPEFIHHVPLELLGLVTTLPVDATQIPWDGPDVRIFEHQAHARGHAALWVAERSVLVAGDMLSDILIPLLDFSETADPIEDYRAGLDLLEGVASDVAVFVPGHGSAGDGEEMRVRIEQDRAYLQALRDATSVDDPRLTAEDATDWLPGVHAHQSELIAERTGGG